MNASSCKAIAATDNEIDELWKKIRSEAEAMSVEEPALKRYYFNTILQYNSLECVLVHHLSNKLANDSITCGEWYNMLQGVICMPCGHNLGMFIRKDLAAILARDPACEGPAHALLNFKGYLGLEASRIAHQLWINNRRSLALAIQSRVSEIFGMDIHPACRIGEGVMLDHATGIVFGETALIGDNCTILHGVTLGGTGKDKGDRHPKLGDGTLVGAGAMILGNIHIGNGCKIAAGSVVLSSLPAHTTAAGVPAKIVGRAIEEMPGKEIDQSLYYVKYFKKEAPDSPNKLILEEKVEKKE
eukprot:CAMPEP_0171459694 /NCGR_PEP_ID=MMETSP0945-20130129/4872_1 /TAXON_ID=109269 /ORGANISM="Vaucheria litorea, Strain CCMP2940" /LENGTH=299 /DNA_ID=CAMNT_0011985757 /DNA_START=90 /DNA_END=986 /DNA_ORIENTATION=+